jgi:hypothetical protein
MRGFEGSSEKHATDQRVTGQRATFGFGFGMFVEPCRLQHPATLNSYCGVGLTPGTLPLCGMTQSIESKLRCGIEPYSLLHLKVGLSPRMEQEIRRRICHESF